MQINVKQHPEHGDVDNIQWIGLVQQTDDVIFLLIDLKTKFAYIDMESDTDDEGFNGSFWIGGDEVQLKLPEGFESYHIASKTNRYTCFVFIFRHELLDNKQKTLWESPEDVG